MFSTSCPMTSDWRQDSLLIHTFRSSLVPAAPGVTGKPSPSSPGPGPPVQPHPLPPRTRLSFRPDKPRASSTAAPQLTSTPGLELGEGYSTDRCERKYSASDEPSAFPK